MSDLPAFTPSIQSRPALSLYRKEHERPTVLNKFISVLELFGIVSCIELHLTRRQAGRREEMAEFVVHSATQPADEAGMGHAFQDFERTLPENCVEYMLFIIETELEPRNSLSGLQTVRKAAVQLCNQLTKDYIWQREAFTLDIKSTNGVL